MKKTKHKDEKINKATKKLNKEIKIDNDSYGLKRLLVILGVIVIICIGIYFLSKLIIDKRDSQTDDNTTVAGSVDYDIATVGTLLNRPYDEYYVMIYNGEDTDAVYYASLLNSYKSKENALKIYYCDLSNALNSKYASSENTGNSSAKNASEFSFGKITLIKIKKGKIASYIEDINKIESILH